MATPIRKIESMRIPFSQVDFIVDRLHVSTTYTEVVKDLYARFRKQATVRTTEFSYAELSKLEKKIVRKTVYRHAIERHKQNRKLYRDVMSGT